jgi:hypothetical protein
MGATLRRQGLSARIGSLLETSVETEIDMSLFSLKAHYAGIAPVQDLGQTEKPPSKPPKTRLVPDSANHLFRDTLSPPERPARRVISSFTKFRPYQLTHGQHPPEKKDDHHAPLSFRDPRGYFTGSHALGTAGNRRSINLAGRLYFGAAATLDARIAPARCEHNDSTHADSD